MELGSTSQWRWLAAVLVILQGAGATAVVGPGAVRDALEEVVTGVLEKHCPSAEQERNQELRIVSSTRAALKEVLDETLSEIRRRPDEDAGYRCSCRVGFIPCGGRCYARLHRAVEYAQAERECTLVGGHLAVPRSRDQSLCVAGLAGYEHVWLGITDREEEGLFMGADGRPVTGNEGQVWSPGQPDNAGGVEHCVSSWKVRGGSSPVRFGEWNDYPCTGIKIFPMCQLP